MIEQEKYQTMSCLFTMSLKCLNADTTRFLIFSKWKMGFGGLIESIINSLFDYGFFNIYTYSIRKCNLQLVAF